MYLYTEYHRVITECQFSGAEKRNEQDRRPIGGRRPCCAPVVWCQSVPQPCCERGEAVPGAERRRSPQCTVCFLSVLRFLRVHVVVFSVKFFHVRRGVRTCAPPAPMTRSLSQNENWKGRRGRSSGGVCRPLRRLIRGCCAFCCARLPVHSTRAGPSPSAAFSRRPPRAALSQRADPPSCRRPRRRRTRPRRRRKQRAPSRRRRACSQNRNSVKKGALHTHRISPRARLTIVSLEQSC